MVFRFLREFLFSLCVICSWFQIFILAQFFSLQLCIFIYWRLHQDFIAAWAFLVEDSGDCSSLWLACSSLQGLPRLGSSGLRTSVAAAHALANWGSQAQYSRHTGLVASQHPDQRSNPCLLHWQVDYLPLNQQGSPVLVHFYKYLFDSCSVQNLSVILFKFKEHLCIEGKEWNRMK